MPGVTIRIFLADGTAQGLRIIEKSNWTGRGLDFARADWIRVRTRSDYDKPGVYVLVGPDPEGTTTIYVGEADELRSRLNQHYAAKDFWTRAIAFTSKDENLNKAHVRYLESRLVGLADAAKRIRLDNGNAPPLPALSEAERAEVEGFLAEMLVIYPLLGVDAFEPPPAAQPAYPLLRLRGRGIEARGRDTPQGFVVLAGSFAAASEVASLHQYVRTIRSKLVADHVLVPDGSRYRLTQDYVFSSPSTAAAAVLGRSSNGRVDWKDDLGRSLSQLQADAGHAP